LSANADSLLNHLSECRNCGAFCVKTNIHCPECRAAIAPAPVACDLAPNKLAPPDPANAAPVILGSTAIAKRRFGFPTRSVSTALGLAIFGVLSFHSLPSIHAGLANQRMATQTNNFVTSMKLARKVAMRSKSWVQICARGPASDSAAQCASGDAAWENGWLIFADRNRDGALDAKAGPCTATTTIGDCIVARGEPLEGSTLRVNPISKGVIFLPNGQSTTQFLFSLCDPTGHGNPRAVALNVSGWARLVSPSRADCPFAQS
jgi:Tfp pilus assembly protein FimT